jgi:glycogen phosphorylase
LPKDIEGFDSLAELALDLRWSWNHATDEVWRQLDPTLWELTQNPWVVLQTVSRDQLKRVLADPAFRKNIDDLLRAKRRRRRRRPGFSKIIRSLPCPASPISAWNSC